MNKKKTSFGIISEALATVPEFRQKELFVLYGQIGYYDLNAIKDYFLQMQTIEPGDDNLHALILAGVGKLNLLEGNYIRAKKALEQAENLVQPLPGLREKTPSNEVSAYVHYEAGHLFRHLLEPEVSKKYFHSAGSLTNSDALNLFVRYQLETFIAEETGNIKLILPYLEIMKPYVIQQILVLHRIGNIHTQNGNSQKGITYIQEGLKLARNEKLDDLIDTLQTSLGYAFLTQGKLELAINTLEKNKNIANSNYTKVLSLENICLANIKLNYYQKALNALHSANELAIKHDIISQIPDQHRFLGSIYEKNLSQFKQAKKQYSLGYKAATDQVSWGLSFRGERKLAIDTYVDFLQRQMPGDLNLLTDGEDFNFMLGKTWKEINDLYYQQAIYYHFAKNTNPEKICSRLEIKPSTYYSLRARLKKNGLSLKQSEESGFNFISGIWSWLDKNAELTWKEMEISFEKDALEFLYKHHGHRKTVLGKVLGLSYTTIVNKTKHIYIKGEDNFTSSVEAPRGRITINK